MDSFDIKTNLFAVHFCLHANFKIKLFEFNILIFFIILKDYKCLPFINIFLHEFSMILILNAIFNSSQKVELTNVFSCLLACLFCTDLKRYVSYAINVYLVDRTPCSSGEKGKDSQHVFIIC